MESLLFFRLFRREVLKRMIYFLDMRKLRLNSLLWLYYLYWNQPTALTMRNVARHIIFFLSRRMIHQTFIFFRWSLVKSKVSWNSLRITYLYPRYTKSKLKQWPKHGKREKETQHYVFIACLWWQLSSNGKQWDQKQKWNNSRSEKPCAAKCCKSVAGPDYQGMLVSTSIATFPLFFVTFSGLHWERKGKGRPLHAISGRLERNLHKMH